MFRYKGMLLFGIVILPIHISQLLIYFFVRPCWICCYLDLSQRCTSYLRGNTASTAQRSQFRFRHCFVLFDHVVKFDANWNHCSVGKLGNMFSRFKIHNTRVFIRNFFTIIFFIRNLWEIFSSPQSYELNELGCLSVHPSVFPRKLVVPKAIWV